jgi:hypothetical protein
MTTERVTRYVRLVVDASGAKSGGSEVKRSLEDIKRSARETVAAVDSMTGGARKFGADASQAAKRASASLREVQREARAIGGASSGFRDAGSNVIDLSQRMNLASVMSGRMGHAVQNAGFQVGDFAVQVASGGGVMRPFIQQGTQLISMFGPWGAVIGAAGAIVGALGMAFLGAGEEAATFRDRADDLNDAVSNLRGAAATGAEGVAALVKQYGEMDEHLISLIQHQTQLNVLLAREALGGALGGIPGEAASQFKPSFLSAAVDFNAPGVRYDVMNEMRDQLGLTRDAAIETFNAIGQLSRAGSLDEQIAAVNRLEGTLSGALNDSANPALVAFANQANEAARKVREYEQAVREAGESSKLLAKPIPELEALASSAGAGRGGRGRSGGADPAKEAEQLAASFAALQASVSPITAAKQQLAAAQETLTAAVAAGLATEQEAVALFERKQELLAGQLDPLTAINEQLTTQIELARLSNEERAIEAELRRITLDLQQQGVDLTGEEIARIREQLEELQKLSGAFGGGMQETLNGVGQAFGSLAQQAEASLGRQSAAYKAAFGIAKAAAIASATVDTAQAVTKALAASPPPISYVNAAIAAAMGAAQIAQITSTAVSGFQTGGFTGAGAPGEAAGRVHRGEFVVNARATRANRRLLEDMNTGRAEGGGEARPVKIVNLLDPSLVGEYLNSPEGEQLIMNKIRRA